MRNDDPPLMAEWHRFVETVLIPEGIAKEASGKFLMAYMGGATTVIALVRKHRTADAQTAMLEAIADECDAFTRAVTTLHERFRSELH